MVIGVKHINQDVIYTVFKKHYCPNCGARLTLVKTSKIVNSEASTAMDYDFSLGDGYMSGKVKFVWKEFYCDKCTKQISIEEMKRIEGKS